MKKLFSMFFKRTDCSTKNDKEKRREHYEKAVRILFPVGAKFLIVGNDFEVNPDAKTYIVLEVCGYEHFTKSEKLVPIFLDEEGKEVISFGIKLRYSEEIKNTLDKLSAREAWHLFSSWEKEPNFF